MLRARLLVAVALGALVVILIVVITGGFTVRTGPLRVSAHDWRTPLVIALVALAGAASSGLIALADAGAAVWRFVDARAPALAIVLAASSAGIGVAFGTYSASASDASGYISEARLFTSARVADDEPLARAVGWPNATWAFSPLGYRPGDAPGELVPTYPPGLPLSIAPVRLLAGELAAYFVVPFLGAVAVLCTYALGARLHSRTAGVVSAALLTTSPIFLFQLVQPMSDVAVTAWWLVALLLALSSVPGAPVASGVAAGLAVLTRPNLAPLAGIVALVASGWPRAIAAQHVRPARLLAFAAGMAPVAAALALLQWRLFGNPLASGYGALGDLFSLANIAPNARVYAARVFHGEGAALGIAVLALAILVVRRTSGSDAVQTRRVFTIASLVIFLVVALYLPYGVFVEWSYLRFFLPALPLLFVLIAAFFVDALHRLPPFVRGPLLVAAVTLACSVNIVRAGEEQAFNLHRYESRYRMAGRYLDSALSPDAVIVTAQESGSARYYANVPILRWDLLGVDLETALSAIRAMGRNPIFLVEDWEAAGLRERFPASPHARLDWPARAEFGDETRVRLFDPRDREFARPWALDRVH